MMTTTTTTTSSSPLTTSFEVYVSKDTFKFNAAHFVAFDGYRERLHGHNYRIGVRVLGQRQIGADGYVIDFGCIKATCKTVCKRMNEHFLCPMHSDVLDITTTDAEVRIECQDKSVFVFPRDDCALLPIVHATTEELAIYLWAEILRGLNADYLKKRGIHTMEVTVAEAIGQEATFRFAIPEVDTNENFELDVRSFIQKGEVVPMPCPTEDKSKPKCCPNCDGTADFSKQLEHIVKAINDGSVNGNDLSVAELQKLLDKNKL